MEKDISRVNTALLPLLLAGVLAILFKGANTSAICSMLLWATACVCAGGVVGFLFGIPKSSSTAPSKPRTTPPGSQAALPVTEEKKTPSGQNDAKPNTNLEEISDWVTKIIVGLTLVNLGEIGGKIETLSKGAARSFVTATAAAPAVTTTPIPIPVASPADESFAYALLVSFSVLGFLCSYLYTRLFLQGAFARSDWDLRRNWAKILDHEMTLAQHREATAPPPGTPSLPTPGDIQAAERVRQAIPPGDREVVLPPIEALASEYDALRDKFPSSELRTELMSKVVRKMSRLAFGAIPFLPRLTSSTQAGQRLAAVVVLKFNFDSAWTEWLLQRITSEEAFVAYHAASALFGAVCSSDNAQKKLIQDGIKAAKLELELRKLSDPGVLRVLDKALRE